MSNRATFGPCLFALFGVAMLHVGGPAVGQLPTDPTSDFAAWSIAMEAANAAGRGDLAAAIGNGSVSVSFNAGLQERGRSRNDQNGGGEIQLRVGDTPEQSVALPGFVWVGWRV